MQRCVPDRNSIIEALINHTPKGCVARKFKISLQALNYFLRNDKNAIKEVLSHMSQQIDANYISPTEALAIAEEAGIKITLATLLNWVQKNELGFQPGGLNSKWFIHSTKFKTFIEGKIHG